MNETKDEFSSSSIPISLDVPMDYTPILTAHQIFRFFILSIGVLVNVLVPVVIGVSRQLHYPRHVFWAALSLCNLLQIFQSLIEIVVFVSRNHLACQIFVLNAGVPYTVILFFLALGALDRYLAIARYEWYKRKATNRAVIYLLLFSLVLTYIIVCSPFWTGYLSLKNCTVNLTHIHCILVYNLLLGIICIILHIMIFIRSRSAIAQYSSNFHQTPISLRFLPALQQSSLSDPNGQNIETPSSRDDNRRTRQQVNATDVFNNVPTQQLVQIFTPGPGAESDIVCFPWLRGRSNFSHLEFRAAFNMSVSVLPVWLITFPVALNAIALYWCIRFKLNCSTIFLINPYMKDLFLFQTIYNPIMYMFCSTEFRCALFRFIRKCICIFH